jgi:hypothetical protein
VQRRVFLLFILFIVLAVFYASITRQSLPAISTEQKAQTDMLNQLDEQVLGQEKSGPESSKN